MPKTKSRTIKTEDALRMMKRMGTGGSGGGGIAQETDPTVPAWAKQPNKPTYTANEVGALPNTTKIPSKTSELTNDSGFITGIPSEYVTETELTAKKYLTAVPSEYVTETELTAKGYATQSDVDAFGGTVEITSGEPVKEKTVLTLNPNSEEVNLYTAEEIDAKLAEIEIQGGGGGGITQETDPTVPSWAKQPSKPTYTASEVGALPNTTKIPTKTSDLSNDSGYLTGIPSEYVTESELSAKKYLTSVPSEYVTETELTNKGYAKQTDIPTIVQAVGNSESSVMSQKAVTDAIAAIGTGGGGGGGGILVETDPTVPNWAKQPNKPTYTASEVGALPSTTKIPTKTSDLSNDSGYLTAVPSEYVTETELTAKKYLTAVPSEYVTETELTAKGYATQTSVTQLSEAIEQLRTTIQSLSPTETVKLWENTKASSAFTAQTISLDLSEYDMVAIGFKMNTSSTLHKTFKVGIGEGFLADFMSASSSKIYGTYRTGSVSTTGVTFATATAVTPSASVEATSNVIPVRIYGIKGVRS